MKKTYSITVQGKTNKWSFDFTGNSKHINEWREDGLEIDEIVNTIPEWIVYIGLAGIWMFFQDKFNFKNPLK